MGLCVIGCVLMQNYAFVYRDERENEDENFCENGACDNRISDYALLHGTVR